MKFLVFMQLQIEGDNYTFKTNWLLPTLKMQFMTMEPYHEASDWKGDWPCCKEQSNLTSQTVVLGTTETNTFKNASCLHMDRPLAVTHRCCHDHRHHYFIRLVLRDSAIHGTNMWTRHCPNGLTGKGARSGHLSHPFLSHISFSHSLFCCSLLLRKLRLMCHHDRCGRTKTSGCVHLGTGSEKYSNILDEYIGNVLFHIAESQNKHNYVSGMFE